MPSEARPKTLGKNKQGPEMVNFRASKLGVGGVRAPRAPLDPHLAPKGVLWGRIPNIEAAKSLGNRPVE